MNILLRDLTSLELRLIKKVKLKTETFINRSMTWEEFFIFMIIGKRRKKKKNGTS